MYDFTFKDVKHSELKSENANFSTDTTIDIMLKPVVKC